MPRATMGAAAETDRRWTPVESPSEHRPAAPAPERPAAPRLELAPDADPRVELVRLRVANRTLVDELIALEGECEMLRAILSSPKLRGL